MNVELVESSFFTNPTSIQKEIIFRFPKYFDLKIPIQKMNQIKSEEFGLVAHLQCKTIHCRINERCSGQLKITKKDRQIETIECIY